MRLFLAIDLPAELRGELGRLQDKLRRACPGWRWTRPEGIHLTLRFLGEVAPEDDAPRRAAWRAVAAGSGPISFRVGGVGVFPAPARPRVLWVGVDAEPRERLAALADAFEEAARREGFAPETRPFRPHLTLARAARDERPAAPPDTDTGILGEVTAREVVLFRSELLPQGARYTKLDAFLLGPSGN